MLTSLTLAGCLALPARAQAPRRPAADAARELVSAERKSPATEENVRRRFDSFVAFLQGSGEPDRYITYDETLLISRLLEEGDAAGAARRLHAAILRLEEPAAPRRRPSSPAAAFERLVKLEKDSPTTEKTVEERHARLIGAVTGSELALRYLAPDEMAPVDGLLAEGRRKEAAVKLREVILLIGSRLPDGPAPARKAREAPAPAAASQADKAAASALYYKAMREYAGGGAGKALELLRAAAKLDPSNRDVAKALERLERERP